MTCISDSVFLNRGIKFKEVIGYNFIIVAFFCQTNGIGANVANNILDWIIRPMKPTTTTSSISEQNTQKNVMNAPSVFSHKCTEVPANDTMTFTNMKDYCEEDVLAWSCQDRCGDAIVFPCSCHPACSVHGVCCEDFSTECVREYESAMSLRNLSSDLITECHSRFKTRLVKCIEKQTMKDRPISNLCSQSMEFGAIGPVTNMNSMLSFKDKFCTYCLENEENLVTWSYESVFNATDSYRQIYNVTYVKTRLENHDRYRAVPPSGVPDFQCFNESKVFDAKHCSKCAKSSAKSRCGEFKSFVEIDGQVYQNVYCHACQKYPNVTKIKNTCRQFEMEPNRALMPQEYFVSIHPVDFKLDLGDLYILDINHPSNPEIEKMQNVAWAEIGCTTYDCTALRCQKGLVNNDGVCFDDLYIWTFAMKLCPFNQLHINKTTICDITDIIDDYPSKRNPLKVDTKLIIWTRKHVHFINIPTKASPKTILEIRSQNGRLPLAVVNDTHLETFVSENSKSVIRQHVNFTINNGTIENMILSREDTHELFILVIVTNPGFVVELPMLADHFNSLFNQTQNDAWNLIKNDNLKICAYGTPGLVLDVDLLERDTLCDVIRPANQGTNISGLPRWLILVTTLPISLDIVMRPHKNLQD